MACLKHSKSIDTEASMKKQIALGLLGLAVLALIATSASADYRRHRTPERYVNLSFFVLRPMDVGYMQRVARNVFLTGNMEYESDEKDLRFQAGAAYMLPHKFLFFRLYGGGGVEFSRNNGYMYPYVSVGTHFWILYTEIVHPLRSNREPSYRFGFSLAF
jgi:hypothetical protein